MEAWSSPDALAKCKKEGQDSANLTGAQKLSGRLEKRCK